MLVQQIADLSPNRTEATLQKRRFRRVWSMDSAEKENDWKSGEL